nr:MoxR family ATPase [Sphingomonas colocasiae]
MGLPLLISGEPGSGKTQLGFAVAHELGLSRPEIFVTRSTSQARDLFYRYDAIGHFHAAQTGRGADPAPFVELQPLGRAIESALPPADRLSASGSERRRSLVIVDEIDKAPRDFPNDLLHEIEHLRFRIPETGRPETPPIDDAFRPIVFITTNAEQLLPDAFLRRCAFVHLRPPTGETLARIIERRFEGVLARDHALVADIVALSDGLRQQNRLERAPSSAELLQFLSALMMAGGSAGLGLREQPIPIEPWLALLAKTSGDMAQLRDALS